MKRLIFIAITGLMAPAILLAQINWDEHLIYSYFDGARSVFAIDIEPDGDVDLLAAAQYANDIAWWKNDGNENFTPYSVATDFVGARSVFAIDMEPDGDVDVLGAGPDKITWWKNDGNENFTPYDIEDFFWGAYCVFAIDIDGDDDVDVLGAAEYGDDIRLWKNNGNENFTTQVWISHDFDGARSVFAKDINGDGDIDVLGAAYNDDAIAWWENDGNENFTPHIIDTLFNGAHSVYAIDIEPDGDVDIVGAGYLADAIAWWENDGSEGFTRHIINTSPFIRARSVYAIDLDDDGDVDILGAAEFGNKISWWENDGSENFTEHTIRSGFNGASSVFAKDIDGDNAVDVLGCAFQDDDIVWWESDLTSVVVIDVGTNSIDIPDTVLENTTLNPKATVKNFGSDAATFNVTCKIEPGGYASTESVTNLSPDSSRQVTFGPPAFTFVSGTYTAKVYTQLTGDTVADNDTVTKDIEAISVLEPFGLISPLDSAMLSDSRPTFIWESSCDVLSGLEEYEIYIDAILRHTGIDTSWTAGSDLSEGWHDWYVIAYDTVGNSLQSTETWSVLIDTTSPFIVTLVSPSDGIILSNSTIDFIWDESTDALSGIDEYILQYCQNSSFISGVVEHNVVDTTFTEVLSDTIWYWRVKAQDKAGNEGVWSEIWSFEVDTEIPDAPNLIAPVSGTYLNNAEVMFEWSEVLRLGSGGMRSPVEYVLQVASDISFSNPVAVDTVTTTSTTMTLGENDYYWRVKAYDLSGNEGPFSVDSFGVDVTEPSSVTLISPSDGIYLNNSTVNFVWLKSSDNLSGIDEYILQYCQNSSFISGVIEHNVVDTTFTEVLSDTIWYWRVKAQDKAGNEGVWSEIWSFEVDTEIPDAPNLIAPVSGTYLNNAEVMFEWSEVLRLGSGGMRSPVEYVLQVASDISFSNPVAVDTVTTTTTTMTLGENDYYWRVKAYDLSGNESSFSVDSFGVDITEPSSVTLISPSDGIYLNNSTVNFIWNKSDDNLSGIDEYILQYCQNSSFISGVVEHNVVDTTFTEVLSDTIWYWRVKARDKVGNEGEWSEIWSFEVDTEIPDAPNLIAPINGVWLSDTLVTFEWTEVMNLALTERINSDRESDKTVRSQVKYIIQVDTLFDFVSPFIVDTVDETSTMLLLFEDFYYWRVGAFDLAGNQGSFTAPDSFGVDITAPVIDSTTVWNDTSYAGPFEVKTKVTDTLSGVDSVLLYYRRDEDPEWVLIVMSPSGEPDWYMDSLPAVSNSDDTVRYYIKAVDRSEPCNIATDPADAPINYYWFIANQIPGVMEYENIPMSFSFGLKSNPAKGKAVFNLSLPHAGSITLWIYDATGRLIDRVVSGRRSAGFYDICWSSHTAGVYFFMLDSPWQRKVGKLVFLK